MSKIATASRETERQAFVKGVHGVRYQVKDVARSVAFYTTHLGFTLKHQQLPAFANVSLGDVDVLLSGPQASGSRPMPDGRQQAPGLQLAVFCAVTLGLVGIAAWVDARWVRHSRAERAAA